jgi:hypothetical protein
MAETKCGFNDALGGQTGSELLVFFGPTLMVNVGFDPNFKPADGGVPVASVTAMGALVDTGATESCIDSALAMQLNLPVVDRQTISGVHGPKEVNLHLA